MKLFRKARRRKPGIYAYRTRKHMRRGVEWGYIGMSTNLPMRFECHAGTCRRHSLCTEKPWYDLKVHYFELRLPWWLGWKWLLLSLETLALLAVGGTRYNWQKNPRKSKVPPSAQLMQRAMRDRFALAGQEPPLRASVTDLAVRTIAALLIIAAPVGYLLTR